MTLAHLDKIEGWTLHISGIDIVHGTPVIDIKPYHYKDAIPCQETTFSEAASAQKSIEFIEPASTELRDICDHCQLDFYDSEQEMWTLIE